MDFTNTLATIKSITIKGLGLADENYFTDSNFSAATIGTGKLLNVDFANTDNAVQKFGFFVRDADKNKEIKSIRYKNTDTGEKGKWSLRNGDFDSFGQLESVMTVEIL